MLKPPIRAAEKNRIATNDFANDIANISIQKYNNIVHNNNNNSNELNFQQTVLSTFVLRYKNPTNNQYTLKVVALGVGTKFLSKSNIENDIDGKCLDFMPLINVSSGDKKLGIPSLVSPINICSFIYRSGFSSYIFFFCIGEY